MTKRTRRIIKRTAALLLCVVLLSAYALPVALADIDITQAELEAGRWVVEDIKMLMSAYAREGAVREIYRQIIGGTLSGADLAFAEEQLVIAIQNRQLAEEASAILREAGRAPHSFYDGTKSASDVINENIDDAANNSNVTYMQGLVAKLAALGILITIPDWGRAYNNAMGQGYLNEDWIETGFEPMNVLVNQANAGGFMDTFFLDTIKNMLDGTGVYIPESGFVELWVKGDQVIGEWFNNLIGRTPDPKPLPPIDYSKVLDMVGAEYKGKTSIGGQRYYIEGATYFREPVHGQSISRSQDGFVIINHFNYKGVMDLFYLGRGLDSYHGFSIIIQDVQNREAWRTSRYNMAGLPMDYIVEIVASKESTNITTSPHSIYTRLEDIGIEDTLDDLEDSIESIQVPIPPVDPTDDIYIDFWRWWEEMQNFDPEDAIDTATETETDPNTDPTPDPDPSPGVSPEPSPEPSTPPKEEPPRSGFLFFPFSIPFDIVDMIKSLNDTPEAPRWEIPFTLPGVFDEKIVIDLSVLEPIMPFVRILILAVFVVGLMKATSSFIKW